MKSKEEIKENIQQVQIALAEEMESDVVNWKRVDNLKVAIMALKWCINEGEEVDL